MSNSGSSTKHQNRIFSILTEKSFYGFHGRSQDFFRAGESLFQKIFKKFQKYSKKFQNNIQQIFKKI